MRNRLLVVALAFVGMLVAGSIGYGAYLASRDSVGLPVTKLEQKPRDLAPTVARKRTSTRAATTTRVAPRPATTDDHGGSRSGDNHGGSGGSGHGGGDD